MRWRDLLEPKMTKILLVGVTLAVLQQWSGINVIFNYAEEIFREAGYGVSSTMFNIVITGAVNLVFTPDCHPDRGPVRPPGPDAHRLRRHRLFPRPHRPGLPCCTSRARSSSPRSWRHSPATAFSLAPVTWVLISEIFPNRIRGAAVSVATSALWIACFILTYTFPLLNRGLGPAGTFWLYAADLRRRVRLHSAPRPGNQGQELSNRSSASSWTDGPGESAPPVNLNPKIGESVLCPELSRRRQLWGTSGRG